ncbi:alpha/beta fold hydrolase [Variovorax ginsengisoli]|uniref:Alpha/beta hydrolase n=1 Tax=Variovorax ginsengisoli TaxID=363844 RepID=A0ABT8SDW6_9BURK|nr:alpha/beta hydrolase [Variovorax ginsengisoli]MDN8617369.1 alpha/beta hydrolase [Variovorax ginsengisoli]MDO1536539.1 alpha/beta hydrolase [Variovorax ginsengisoli]
MSTPARAGDIAFLTHGNSDATPVVLAHSILSSGAMWSSQASLLVEHGFFVVCIDARGHGASGATPAPYSMDGLADDTVSVLDTLKIERAHYVGLSLGGMSGVGLGLRHADRLLSLCLCDMRADTPAAAAAPWDERIAIAQAARSCAPLAEPTLERWFGRAFLEANASTASLLRNVASTTSVDGFAGCARAIQAMDYLAVVDRVETPTSLIVGARDGTLPDAMRALAQRIRGAVFEVIEDAGHLPNVERPDAFNAALLRHLERTVA